MKAETAVALVLWHFGRTSDGLVVSARNVARILRHLADGGLEVPDLVLDSSDGGNIGLGGISLLIERFQARGILKRLTTPLQLSHWGQDRLGKDLRRATRASPAALAEMQRALEVLKSVPPRRTAAGSGGPPPLRAEADRCPRGR